MVSDIAILKNDLQLFAIISDEIIAKGGSLEGIPTLDEFSSLDSQRRAGVLIQLESRSYLPKVQS